MMLHEMSDDEEATSSFKATKHAAISRLHS